MTKRSYFSQISTVACLALFFPVFFAHGAKSKPLNAPNLGIAGNFVILSKAGISNIPNSSIVGHVGVSPIASTAITGFSLIADPSNVFSTSSSVVGNIYAANYAVPTPTYLTTAIGSMQAAYTDAAGRTKPKFKELSRGNIGGLTLTPGLYKWSTPITILADIVISGGPNDVWIFQTSGGITMAAAKNIVLKGGAQAKNIFWQVAGAVTVGTTAHFEGIILSKTAIHFQTGASMNGRAFAQTAVTLDQNTIVQP